VWGVGGVWGVWGYVRHSTDCTCCDFGHLRFLLKALTLFSSYPFQEGSDVVITTDVS
jgi:hypothetical protein